MTVRAHPAYRDSGIEWIGAVPVSWEIWPLKRVGAITYGLGQPPEYREDGAPFIRATNVNRGALSKEGLVYVNEANLPLSRVTRLKQGDIIVVRSGAYTGDSALVTAEWIGAIAGFDMVIRCTGAVSPSFVAMALLSSYVLEAQINLVRMRAAQPHLNSEELGEVWLAVPPLVDQLAIITFLDREIGKIDALVAEQERLIALLKEKRQAVISQAVTKGLDLSVPMKPSGAEWLGDIPEGWDVSSIKHVVSNVVDCLHTTPHYDGETKFPAVRTADIERGRLLLEQVRLVSLEVYEERIQRLRPVGGDILYTREGERFGLAALVPSGVDLCLGQRMMMFRASPEHDPAFLMWVLNSDCVYQQVLATLGGATAPHVNIADVINFRVPIPPKAEQSRIAKTIERKITDVDGLIAEVETAALLLRERRAALISAAVTGKIDVRTLVQPARELVAAE